MGQVVNGDYKRRSLGADLVRAPSSAMSVSKATAGALCLSTFTLLISLYAIYNIYTDVRGIWMQLDEQMVEFKIQTDDIWTQMLGLGAATPSTRQRRQGKEQYGAYEAQGVNAGPVCGELSIQFLCFCRGDTAFKLAHCFFVWADNFLFIKIIFASLL
ncbi:unnamed protein product [Cylicostephanus goldi]|uniref:Nematode cuticle collagen N-terminal domain-containing protein n=1 Tax=Cylicostephanus goldi TaxID=71465 RepID=A0A3P6UU16_CYLGO|nr:unnamed protein product [Cylicostephanus goldi]